MTIRCCSPLFDLAHGDCSDQQATLVCITTCERTVFSGRNSNESRESLPGSTLIEDGVIPASRRRSPTACRHLYRPTEKMDRGWVPIRRIAFIPAMSCCKSQAGRLGGRPKRKHGEPLIFES